MCRTSLFNAHIYKMALFLGRMGRWSFNSRSMLQRRYASNSSSHLEIDCTADGNRRLLIAAITLPITLYLVSNQLFFRSNMMLNAYTSKFFNGVSFVMVFSFCPE